MAPKKQLPRADSYAVGDTVLGQVKGFPYWPGQVVDGENRTAAVRRDKPKSGLFYCVRFYPAGDYAWLKTDSISPLSKESIQAFVDEPPKGKDKKNGMLEAYKTALDPEDWAADVDERERLAEEQKANDDVNDELMDEDGEEGAAKVPGPKRKRKSDASLKKDESTAKKARKEGLQSLVNKKKGKAEKNGAYSEDEGTSSKPAKVLTAEEGAKTVKDWRHKLQRVFLDEKKKPTEDDVTKVSKHFDNMEGFPMQKDWLTESKLGKVLKRIALLKPDQVPLDSKFNFRERASSLAQKWQNQIGGGDQGKKESPVPTPAPAAAPAPAVAAPAPVVEEAPKPAEPVAAAPAPAPEVKEPEPAPAPAAPVVEDKPAAPVAPETNGETAATPAPVAPAAEEAKTEVVPSA